MSETQTHPDYPAQLKALRERRGDAITRMSKVMQEQRSLHKTLLAALAAEPKTVPELAAIIGKPSQEIFWHLMALKKYNRIVEDKKKGEYVGYRTKS